MKKLIVGITAPSSVILITGQLQYFKNKGYKTYLMAPSDEKVTAYCEREGCEHLPIEIEREISITKDFKSLLSIYKHFKRVKPDVINFGTPKVSLLGLTAARLLGIKNRIYTCRGYRFEHETGFKRKLLKQFEKLTASCAHSIICISNSVRDFGLENKLFSKEKSVVINKGSSNGLDLTRFNPELITAQEIMAKKQELNILEKDFVFGFVGRLVDRKGVNELFYAFETLQKTNANFKLVVVGSVESEQIADKTLIDKMKSHPSVILTGTQYNVPLYLSLMDVFVLPAWWEGFGNVLIQAAAMKKPIISCEVTGCKDAVNNGFNGDLIETKSIDKLVEKMKEFYQDKSLRDTYGANGVEWAKNFDSEVIWQGMDNLYQKR